MAIVVLAILSITSIINAKLPNQSEINEILRVHNDYRASVMPPSDAMLKLKWTGEGAEKAEIMAMTCIFDHDNDTDRAIPGYVTGGQNIYATTEGANWTEIIKEWYDEVKDFKFGLDGGNFMNVGHYTQVVWSTTKEIGCGWHECPTENFFTCNYYPPGNAEPYYIPYENSTKRSCTGCIKGGICAKSGTYAGKLLEKCDRFCTDEYSNCIELANEGHCPLYGNQCIKSCNKACR